jgi:putative peptidoglycan lipid II flippase
VVQLSAYVDTYLASLVATGAVTAVFNAQVIYTLPVSLFGMSVSVAELTTMSREVGGAEAAIAERLRARLDAGLARIAFLVIPSAVAFAALGDVIAGALFQAGRFARADVEWVWGILAGASIGLLAATLGRLYASTLFALRDTRAPLRFALVRIGLQVVLGLALSQLAPAWLGIDARWGAAGLTVAASIGGWVELALLRREVSRRIGSRASSASRLLLLWSAAVLAAGAAWGVRLVTGELHPIARGALVLPAFGAAYLGLTLAFGIGEARAVLERVARRVRR